ncbi:MAG: tetratricopeptide repeat protein, partial [Acidobacteriota bacterium]|nr:tetratricopeptide repeat protein [Acidobacteriota bacterium]
IDSIAVMPFTNGSADPQAEYLSDGLTESLINSLSQLPDLRVMARSSVFRYKGQQTDLQTVGRDLKVQAVLVGRVAQLGDNLSVSAELVDTRDNRQIWGEQYNRKFSDVLAIQQDISHKISEKLRQRLTSEEQRQLAKRGTQNPRAYEAYLKGHHLVNRRAWQSAEKSIEYLEQAVRIDPAYALAYADLAYAYSSLSSLGARPPREVMPKAREAVTKALEIDNTLAKAHVELAAIRLFYDWNWEEAERSYRHALELDPNSGHAHWSYASLLLYTKRFDEALAEMKRALELEPVSVVINRDVAKVLYFSRRYDEAIEQCRKTLELDPGFHTVYGYLGSAYEQKGQYAEALAAQMEANALRGGSPETVAALRGAAEAGGWRGYWQKRLEVAQELSKQEYVSPYQIAGIYARLGEKEEALQWLEKAYEERHYQITRLNVDPRWDGLRKDVRFINLVRRAGLEADPRPQ